MKLIRVKKKDAEIGNISVGLAENGKGIETSEGKTFYWDEKAGNITVADALAKQMKIREWFG